MTMLSVFMCPCSMPQILLEPELFNFLGLALVLGIQVELDSDFRRDDILQSIAALVHTFFFTCHLHHSYFIVTTEFTVLVCLHALREQLHGFSFKDVCSFAGYDFFAVLVNVVVSCFFQAEVGVVAEGDLAGVGLLDLGDAEVLYHFSFSVLTFLATLLKLADVELSFFADLCQLVHEFPLEGVFLVVGVVHGLSDYLLDALLLVLGLLVVHAVQLFGGLLRFLFALDLVGLHEQLGPLVLFHLALVALDGRLKEGVPLKVLVLNDALHVFLRLFLLSLLLLLALNPQGRELVAIRRRLGGAALLQHGDVFPRSRQPQSAFVEGVHGVHPVHGCETAFQTNDVGVLFGGEAETGHVVVGLHRHGGRGDHHWAQVLQGERVHQTVDVLVHVQRQRVLVQHHEHRLQRQHEVLGHPSKELILLLLITHHLQSVALPHLRQFLKVQGVHVIHTLKVFILPNNSLHTCSLLVLLTHGNPLQNTYQFPIIIVVLLSPTLVSMSFSVAEG